MQLIESYSFGRLVVNGTTYTKDVLIYPDSSILSPWWRRSGHLLELTDIEKMIDMNPEVIIAGTGANGLMRTSDALQHVLEEKEIEFIALPTGKAITAYNEMVIKKPTGGCFHLTC